MEEALAVALVANQKTAALVATQPSERRIGEYRMYSRRLSDAMGDRLQALDRKYGSLSPDQDFKPGGRAAEDPEYVGIWQAIQRLNRDYPDVISWLNERDPRQ